MNALVNATSTTQVTMTSLELVDFINSQRVIGEALLAHSDFMKKVPKVLGEGHGKFSDTYIHAQNGQTYPCYKFPKRESCLMAMSYSYELQAAVFDKMTALEKQVVTLDLNNPEYLRTALLGYTEKVIELTHQVETLTPKAIALDRIADTESLFTIRQAAKTIKIKERDLVAMLLNRGWAFRDARSVMQPYAEKIALGYVTSIMTKPITGNDGQDRVFSQLRITAKGVTRLSYVVAKELAA